MTVPSLSVPRGQRIALAACMFFTTGSFGFLQPFIPLYLEAAHLSKSQIGLVTGIGSATVLVIQPLLGRLSDRLDVRRPLMVLAALIAGAAYFSFRSVHGLLAFLLLTVLGANGYQYLNVAGGVLVGRLVSGARGGAAYAGYRVWGSVGYIVVAMGTGLLVRAYLPPQAAQNRAALGPIFAYGPLLFLMIAALSLAVPDRPRPATPAATPTGTDAVPSDTNERNLRWFLFAFFLYQFGLYGASAYLSLFLKALGAPLLFITATYAAGVICEVLVMTQVGRLTDTYGRRPALVIAFLLMPLRLLLYIPATGPLWVLLVQTLHGINYGIVGTIAVVYINDLASDHERGAAQARLAATAGLAVALGPAVCGWLAQTWGFGAMFGAMAIVGAAGALVFVFRVRESHATPTALPGRLGRWLAG